MSKAIVLVRWPGMAATKAWAKRHQLTAQEEASLEKMNLDTDLEMREALDFGGTEFIYPCGEGGLIAALRGLSQRACVGANIDGDRIPWLKLTLRLAKGEARSVYEADSRGCFLAISEKGGELADHLRGMGIAATVIGKLNARPGPVLLQAGGAVTVL